MSFIYRPIIGDISLFNMFAYFFIYAFLGWIAEVVFATLKTGRFVNRGFLNGPVCPIYGVGIAVLVLLFNTIADKWLLLFVCGTVFTSVLEFLTGFFLDKMFHTKWWDYSKEPFNVKGYICLRFSLIWGIAVVLAFFTVIPLTQKVIDFIPDNPWGTIIIAVFFITLIADFVAVINQLKGLNKNLKEINAIAKLLSKNSDALGEKISDATVGLVKNLASATERVRKTRLGKAFPIITTRFEKLKDQIEEKKKNKDE